MRIQYTMDPAGHAPVNRTRERIAMYLLAFGLPGGWEWIIILGIGLLLFGKRLPEVGRSVGRSIVEFKKGIKGIEDEIEDASSAKRIDSSSPASEFAADAPADTVRRSDASEAAEENRSDRGT